MPTLLAIARYWESQGERFPENECYMIGLGEPYCFACGMLAPVSDLGTLAAVWRRASGHLVRAHLADRRYGGPDSVDNLVVLCRRCHGEMPSFYDTDMALYWVRSHEQNFQRQQRELRRFLALVGEDRGNLPPVVQAWFDEFVEFTQGTTDEALADFGCNEISGDLRPRASLWATLGRTVN